MRASIVGGSGYALATVGANKGETRAPCDEQADEELEAVWTPAVHESVREAVLASGTAFAEDTWARINPPLDDYAERWRQQRESTCAAHQAGERSDEAHLMQLACLAQRRASLEGLVQVLSSEHVELRIWAVQTLARLAGQSSTAADAVLTAADDTDENVRAAARNALAELEN